MAVTVRLFAAARSAAGTSQVQCSTGTLREILQELTDSFPAISQVLPQCSFLVNEVSCKDLDAVLLDESMLDVLPPFAGG